MTARLVVMMLLVNTATALISINAPLADDRPLLIETHGIAGLKCAECHQERPPTLTPPNTTCLRCHGDQQTLANKTKEAFPNPHMSPHIPEGQTQICSECHHVHRKSEVSCTSCHRDFYFNVK